MKTEVKKRAPRIPKTPEEVAELVLLKKMREHKKLESFKKKFYYKLFNLFNIGCFFIYCELIICFFGPCNYETHYSKNMITEYGEARADGERIVTRITVVSQDNEKYSLNVNDYIPQPAPQSVYFLGSDFLLKKEIKAMITSSGKQFGISRVSPLLFLSFLVGILSCIIFSYNLNQKPYSLGAITVINGLTLFVFLCI